METVAFTVADDDTTLFPPLSRTSKTGCVVNAAPDSVPTDCVVRTSCVAAPAVTLNEADVTDVSPGAVNVNV